MPQLEYEVLVLFDAVIIEALDGIVTLASITSSPSSPPIEEMAHS